MISIGPPMKTVENSFNFESTNEIFELRNYLEEMTTEQDFTKYSSPDGENFNGF